MITYLIGVSLTFSILLRAFLKDTSTPKTDRTSWLVVAIGSLLWFVTLPCVIRQTLLRMRTLPNLPSQLDRIGVDIRH